MPKDCSKKEAEIAVLQSQMDDVKEFIKEMNENHLPHINKEISNLNTKFAYGAGGLAVLIIILKIFF